MATLKELRKRRKLTQKGLADLVGVTQPTIAKLENGTLRSPSWDVVSRISEVLKSKPQDLFPVEHREAV